MGLFDTLTSALGGGGQQQVQNMAAGQGDFADPGSPDHAGMATRMQHAPPGVLSGILSQVAPAVGGGTNPMGGLESAALGMVAGALMSKLTGGGVSQQSLLSRIPGLGTTDPQQMNAGQVAQVAQYAQQNHPDLFGQAAAQVGQQQPGLLGALMGHAGMSQAAMGLASHFLSQR